MPLLLHELQWADEPLVPKVSDPAWDAEVKALMGGMMPDSLQRLAPSPWVRRAYLDATRTPMHSLADPEIELAVLVTSQENACRYCYGMARTRLRMLGFTEEMVDKVERRAQLAEGDDRERELVRFCRDLARSKPRPAKKARETMARVGFSDRQTAELAYTVAIAGFCNRVSTLIASDPEYDFEANAPKPSLWKKLSAWRPAKAPGMRPPPPNHPTPTFTGPYGNIVRLLDGSAGAATLEATINSAFASDVLPQRTLALIFAVVARTLDCGVCEKIAADLLDAQCVEPAVRKEVLETLGSSALTDVEAVVIPWARETVWMPEQPARIQERSRPVLDVIGPRMFIEVVGGAALANACARVAMLET